MPRETDRPDIEAGAVVRARKLRVRREAEPETEYSDADFRWHSEARVAVRWLADDGRKTQGRRRS
jgi:hypothetical protein